ncbi:hypothetical protein DICPUDRAFT_155533 [Dictyostelium purpureum]|uniref:SPX domain-containing protein n=1 Tax=Dictyostelium purpureum TaxID=5786 RepID=F0ZU91_DICPU|nr:uncharacterized protein DICPUDRAFT_155533 [Dictyostelium purpureum]EGC32499.1 hypothetical protein DICPUDRAFT_155533 [Dictyostelium purpureum]|eukprot:XP_003290992.1 hypothetical protein DICPUDRAFT_155533 [Dictyostelium purpureum]
MKFREYLNSHIVSHWRDKYLDYEYLKQLIDKEYNNAPNSLDNSAIIDFTQSIADQHHTSIINQLSESGSNNINTQDEDHIKSYFKNKTPQLQPPHSQPLPPPPPLQQQQQQSQSSPTSPQQLNIPNHHLHHNRFHSHNIRDEDTTLGSASPFSNSSVGSPRPKAKSELNSPLLSDQDNDEIEMEQINLDSSNNNNNTNNKNNNNNNNIILNNKNESYANLKKAGIYNLNKNLSYNNLNKNISFNNLNQLHNSGNINNSVNMNKSMSHGNFDGLSRTSSHLNLEVLTSQIEKVMESRENMELMESGIIQQQENFQTIFIDQVNKVDTFFVERYRKTKKKCVELCNMIPFLSTKEQYRTIRNIDYVKQGLHDNYHYLEMLESFKDVNIKGFNKVLNKYEKKNRLIANECRKYLMDDSRMSQPESPVKDLAHRIKHLYARYFTGNDIKLASNQIKSHAEDEKFEKQNVFVVGLLLGVCLILTGQVFLNYFYYYPHDSPPVDAPLAWLLFRISLLPILLGSMFSAMSYIWEKSGINYVFIFEFKPDHKRSPLRYFKFSLIYITMWLLSINFYVDSSSHVETMKYLIIIPIVLVLVALVLSIQPFPILAHRTRFWVLKKVGKVISAPFVPVRFPDFFMSIQLLSLGEFLFNIQSMVCVFNYSALDPDEVKFCSQSGFFAFPLLNALPYYWRVMQCFRRYYETRQFFPHITSAIRSIFSIVSLVINYIALEYATSNWHYIRIIWFVINVIGSFYKWYADMAVDWGFLLNYKTNKAWPLREKLVYKRKWIYYIAMCIDFFLRFYWLLIFSIRRGSRHRLDNPMFLFLFSFGEVFWASQFIFFRVESEHCNSQDHFSLFQDIPVPFSKEYSLYMEERRKRKLNKGEEVESTATDHNSIHNSINSFDEEHEIDDQPQIPPTTTTTIRSSLPNDMDDYQNIQRRPNPSLRASTNSTNIEL